MKKIIFLLMLVISVFLTSCGSSASSVNVDYSSTFTADELDLIEAAYKAAYVEYNDNYYLLSLIVEPMTFITTMNPGNPSYDVSYKRTVYLEKVNNEFVVTENSASTTYATLTLALEQCL